VDRLENEFGASVALDPAPWTVARRTDEAGAELVRRSSLADVLFAADGSLLAVFRNRHGLEYFERDHPGIVLDHILTR
jgi:peptide chain release factor 3